MWVRIGIGAAVALLLLLAVAIGVLWTAGRGTFVETQHAGTPEAPAVPAEVIRARAERAESGARRIGVAKPRQILFGDLHVHTTFSADAFTMSLPMTGGEGAHPVADACDYARYCSGLDFWSINDHAITSTPRRWTETVEAIRQCNAVSGTQAAPDMVSYLGWEWTQIGSTPENHYGHKNVVLRDLADDRIPSRPIAAAPPPGSPSLLSGGATALLTGLMAIQLRDEGGPELARYMAEVQDVEVCPEGPVRELPTDCREQAATPRELFAKLHDWGSEALVIPHGTTWGMYTPPGSSWDKQLTPEQHDPELQSLVEVFSGHGNSEEFRPWREVILTPDGSRSCPGPTKDYLPDCWRAGEIIRDRCLASGEDAEECEGRAEEAQRNYVDADRAGGTWTVPGSTVEEWQDAGQCRDCFQPAFGYRPRSSVQYLMSLARPASSSDGKPLRFRFGFLSSSDNHSARPGTGYKEVARTEFTEGRFGHLVNSPLGRGGRRAPQPYSERLEPDAPIPVFGRWPTERAASFFLTGGLAAVHSNGRSREAIWQALERREVYGTSGPRILLWFDLLNPPGSGVATAPMGSEVALAQAPIFQVRAVGSFEQLPGCPDHATAGLEPERRARLCRDECYHPSDRRRHISRIEVVRIRYQKTPDDAVAGLIEDPWQVHTCEPNPAGCRVVFTDPGFARGQRDALYYVRAIEETSPAVAADPLHCKRDAEGRCVEMAPCFGRPESDDCLAPTEERAWSSPIFVDYKSQPAG